MKQKCQNLEMCGFFKNFSANSQVVKNGWIKLYCDDLEKSENCARKQFRKNNGKSPADNITPTGKMLSV